MKRVSKLFFLSALLIFPLNQLKADTTSYLICEANGKLSIKTKCPRGSSAIKNLGNLFNKTAQKGVTYRGFYDASMTVLTSGGGNNVMYGSISYGAVLSEVPTAHYIAYNETPPTECPGSVDQPEAAAGHLCVYEDGRLNISSANVSTTAGETPSKFGASVNAIGTTTGLASIRGTWAVTAP